MQKHEPGVLRALVDLVLGWCRVDRVRVSPSEGRLLRLEPPCLLRIHGAVAQVTRRNAGQGPEGPYVVYECDDGTSEAKLWVYPVGATHRPVLRWQLGGHELLLSEEDVEVYG